MGLFIHFCNSYSLVRLSFFCEHGNLVAEEWYGKGDVFTVDFFILLNLSFVTLLLYTKLKTALTGGETKRRRENDAATEEKNTPFTSLKFQL